MLEALRVRSLSRARAAIELAGELGISNNEIQDLLDSSPTDERTATKRELVKLMKSTGRGGDVQAQAVAVCLVRMGFDSSDLTDLLDEALEEEKAKVTYSFQV